MAQETPWNLLALWVIIPLLWWQPYCLCQGCYCSPHQHFVMAIIPPTTLSVWEASLKCHRIAPSILLSLRVWGNKSDMLQTHGREAFWYKKTLTSLYILKKPYRYRDSNDKDEDSLNHLIFIIDNPLPGTMVFTLKQGPDSLSMTKQGFSQWREMSFLHGWELAH